MIARSLDDYNVVSSDVAILKHCGLGLHPLSDTVCQHLLTE